MRLFWICILALPALAQEEKLVSLSGTVVNSATGEPVKRAQVQITHFSPRAYGPGTPPKGPNKPLIRTVMTDATGSFRFDGVPEGEYGCMAQKPQFVAAQNTGCSAPAENVQLALDPLGVITGRVVDQDGLPLRLVNIYALSSRIQDGLRQIKTDRNVTTDDRGMYRLWNLTPGKYLIKASGFGASTVSYIGDTSPANIGESFPATFFGGRTPIDIKPGAEAVADLTLTVDRAFTIRGTLANIAPRTPVKFELVTGSDASPVRVALNNETGRFEVAAVLPGSYTLRAIQDKAIAELPLTMPASDIEGVAMTLEPPVDVPVNLRFTNEAKTVETIEGPQMMGGCSPLLRGADGASMIAPPGKSITGVPVGRYRLIVQCFNAWVRSATYGSQDVVANPEFMITPGATLDIVAAYGSGTVSGTLESPGDKLAWILFVPQIGGDAVAQPVQPGEFELNLGPGSWLAYAVSNIEDVEFRNREIVRTLTGGVPVQVENGKETKITIPGVVR